MSSSKQNETNETTFNLTKQKILTFNNELQKYKQFTGREDSPLVSSKLFGSIVMTNHNGTGDWSFSCATIDFNQEISPTYFICALYKDTICRVFSEMINKQAMDHLQRESFDKLLDFVCNLSGHTECLARTTDDHTDKTEIRNVLALHIFGSLVPSANYKVNIHGSQNLQCGKCHEKVETGDTSFGLAAGWHGITDIEMNHIVIKVKNEDTFSENTDSDSSHWKKKSTHSQFLAQAIVNAFCNTKTNKLLYGRFIPSFLATKKYISIAMYNVEKDELLLTEQLPIWINNIGIEPYTILDLSTIFYIWMALNFSRFEINTEGLTFKESMFRSIAGKKYQLYMEKVERPLESFEESFSLEFTLSVYDFPIHNSSRQKILHLEQEFDNEFNNN